MKKYKYICEEYAMFKNGLILNSHPLYVQSGMYVFEPGLL